MMVEELVKSLEEIQNKIITIPIDGSADATAQQYLEDLRSLLQQVHNLDEISRQRIKPAIESFSSQLSTRVNELESQLTTIQEEAEKTQVLQRTIKAYGNTGKIF